MILEIKTINMKVIKGIKIINKVLKIRTKLRDSNKMTY